MSTWHMFPDAADDSWWRFSDPDPNARPQPDSDFHTDDENPGSVNRFPSMAELLLQGCSKLAAESQMSHGGGVAMFRSGLGRSVSVKPSSLAKAASILGASDSGRIRGSGGEIRVSGGFGESLFQTASGKTVNISSKGPVKAKKVLSLDGDVDGEGSGLFSSGFSVGGVKDDVLRSRTSVNHVTGSVQSGLTDVSAVRLRTPGGRSGSVSANGCVAGSVESRSVNEFVMHSEMTSSVFTPSSVQLQRPSRGASSGTHDAGRTGSVQSRFKRESKLHHLQTKMPSSACTPSSAKLAPGEISECISSDLSFMQPQKPNVAPKPPSIKFNTAGGRSIYVSADALQRARNLLGDPDLGTSFDEGNLEIDHSFSKECTC